jgi:hypothetical protein
MLKTLLSEEVVVKVRDLILVASSALLIAIRGSAGADAESTRSRENVPNIVDETLNNPRDQTPDLSCYGNWQYYSQQHCNANCSPLCASAGSILRTCIDYAHRSINCTRH